MRSRYEFSFHPLTVEQAKVHGVEPTLAFLGSQGWEIRGLAPLPDGSLVAALQRPLDEDVPLAAPDALAAKLSEPLVAPLEKELAFETRAPTEN